MKKCSLFLSVLFAIGGVAFAQMDQTILSSSSITTNVGTTTGIVKGEIFSIRMDGATGKTNAIAITTAEGETLLSVSALTADATYYPRIGVNKASDGSAISIVTTTGTNTLYSGNIGVASLLTMTVTPAASTTGTNETKAIITFKK